MPRNLEHQEARRSSSQCQYWRSLQGDSPFTIITFGCSWIKLHPHRLGYITNSVQSLSGEGRLESESSQYRLSHQKKKWTYTFGGSQTFKKSTHLHKNYVDDTGDFYLLVYFIKCLSISIRKIFHFYHLLLMSYNASNKGGGAQLMKMSSDSFRLKEGRTKPGRTHFKHSSIWETFKYHSSGKTICN